MYSSWSTGTNDEKKWFVADVISLPQYWKLFWRCREGPAQTTLKLKHVYILDIECLWATVYTTDTESKQFLIRKSKCQLRKKTTRCLLSYFCQGCFELHAMFKNVKCFSVSDFCTYILKLIFNGCERWVAIILASYLKKTIVDVMCWKWWEE